MRKIIIFLRGVESPFKRRINDAVMKWLNPDPNHVLAFRVAMLDYLAPNRDKSAIKAARTTCKNLSRRVLRGFHQEPVLVVDNETLNHQDFQPYFFLGRDPSIQITGVGIDVYRDVNIFPDLDPKKLNLQDQNVDVFIASMYKYIRVETNTDVPNAIRELDSLVGKGE